MIEDTIRNIIQATNQFESICASNDIKNIEAQKIKLFQIIKDGMSETFNYGLEKGISVGRQVEKTSHGYRR